MNALADLITASLIIGCVSIVFILCAKKIIDWWNRPKPIDWKNIKDSDQIIEFEGCFEKGDGGGGLWKLNGVSEKNDNPKITDISKNIYDSASFEYIEPPKQGDDSEAN